MASLGRYESAEYTIKVAPPELEATPLAVIDLIPIVGTVSILGRVIFGEILALYGRWDAKSQQEPGSAICHFWGASVDELVRFDSGCLMRDHALYSNKSAFLFNAVATAALWLVGTYFLPATLVATALPLMLQNVCVLFAIHNYNAFVPTYHALDNATPDTEEQPTLHNPQTHYHSDYYFGHIKFETANNNRQSYEMGRTGQQHRSDSDDDLPLLPQGGYGDDPLFTDDNFPLLPHGGGRGGAPYAMIPPPRLAGNKSDKN